MRRKTIYWGAFILEWFNHLQDPELTGVDYKILFYLCEKMQFTDNRVLIRQKEVAEELHMDKGNISKSIKKLCNKQFISKIPNGFMVNPHLFYIGKSNPNERYLLRMEFDQSVTKNGLVPLFDMNEEDAVLYKGLERDSEEVPF